MTQFEINQKVNSTLAFTLVLVLGFWVAWISVTTAEEIIHNASDSSTFNLESRLIDKNKNMDMRDQVKNVKEKSVE